MLTAFERTSAPFARQAADEVLDVLDDWARRWTSEHRSACEATRLRGEQSEEVMQLRMVCLDRQLKELGALVDQLGEADATAVQNAVPAAVGAGFGAALPQC